MKGITQVATGLSNSKVGKRKLGQLLDGIPKFDSDSVVQCDKVIENGQFGKITVTTLKRLN